MQAINTRKYLAASVLLTLGFVGVYALSRQESSCCSIPAMFTEPKVAPSNSGDGNMTTTNVSNAVVHVGESSFDQVVLQAKEPVLVDFYAEWCGPCKRLAPLLEEIAAETPGIRVVKVNVDENPNLAWKYQIESIPSVKVFRNGKITAESLGLASKMELKDMLRR